MQKILLPMDGSKAALRALEHVAGRASRGEKIQLDVIYVQPIALPTEFVSRSVVDRMQARERDKALADPRIREFTQKLGGRVHVREGDVVQQIIAFVKKRRCAEIVMGTRGLGPLKGLLLGSTAAKVVQLAPVPVTIVK